MERPTSREGHRALMGAGMKRISVNKRKAALTGGLALLLTLMQIGGWQRSMKYGSSVHSHELFLNIGVLEGWQCMLAGVVEWIIFSVLLYLFFSFLDKRCSAAGEDPFKVPKYFWALTFVLLFGIYVIWLVGCYPGFYNYDGGSQLIQVMYEETPYDAHHPLLHTFIVGGIITLGYHIRSVDLSFGIFLYCLFQMGICALSFGYSVRFIFRYTRRRLLAASALVFYAICPPIVMFAMSTTKDTLCFAALLPAVLKLYEIYRADTDGQTIVKKNWIIAGLLLTLSCLLRNNIVYAIALLVVFTLLFYKRRIKGQLVLLGSVIVLYLIINTGLIRAFDATPGSITEALSVPFQQIARLYVEEGEEAFDSEERELLYAAIEPEMLSAYNPVISDTIKYAFWRHLDTLKENKWEYTLLWARKGLQYPKIYLDSFLDNTYQAWYPGTVLKGKSGNPYFDISGWQEECGKPRLPGLYDYYKEIGEVCSYRKYPAARLFFSIGAMLWVVIITWVYGLWSKDRSLFWALLPVLLVCVTNLLGPVSEVRYYLILFYLFPVCMVFLFGRQASFGSKLVQEPDIADNGQNGWSK